MNRLSDRKSGVARPSATGSRADASSQQVVSTEGFDPARIECHGLDTPERVCFYEQDFYVLSNFSSFAVHWSGLRFDTAEALYHWLKFASGIGMFAGHRAAVAEAIRTANSAHDAFKLAQEHRDMRRPDWDEVKATLMKRILHEKARQHEYVRRKLLATGDRELVENSWRDDVWGWGPNCDGQNLLGKLWMEVRVELASAGEAHRAETTEIGSVHEHATGKAGDARSEDPQ